MPITRLLIFTLVLFSLNLKPGLAHPPSDIALIYDAEKKVLVVDIKHVSDNMRKHHIRRIQVFKNDADPLEYSLVKQTSGAGLVHKVPLNAKSKDQIRVKAICSEAGYKEATLIIP